MKKLLACILFAVGLLGGCAKNHYNVPTRNVADKVKVLGVAPILIDADSEISHPQREQLLQLVAEINRKYEPQLVRNIKTTGSFYAVTTPDGDPVQLFRSLVSRREKRDDATILYNKYFWKNDELRAYMQKNRLDAVMLIVISGLTKTEKLYSSNLLSSVEADFNFLTMTAQIVDPAGTVLWEYPNFRGRLLTYYPMINLQYPDFSEAEANLSKKTLIQFKSLDGVRRTLDQKRKDWLQRETQESEVYSKQFDEMVSRIQYDLDREAKPTVPGADKPDQRPADLPKAPEQSTAPTVPAPSIAPAPPVAVPPQ